MDPSQSQKDNSIETNSSDEVELIDSVNSDCEVTKHGPNLADCEVIPPPKVAAATPVSDALPPKGKKRQRKSSTVMSTSSSRERSMVWEHFEKIERPLFEYKDGKKVQVGAEPRAKCRYCSTDLARNTNDNGTSSLKRHIQNVCKRYPGRADLESVQKVFVSGGKLNEPTLAMTSFDSDKILKACVEMIVIGELPFTQTEKRGFKRFCRVAVPRWVIPGRGLLVKTFWDMYADEKKQLKDELASHCVNLTTDTWTSLQNINYMVVTAHFIDDGWNLHKRILNFCVIPNHQGNTIGKLLETCLLDWGIERVLTILVDNASANKVAIEYIAGRMRSWDKPPVLGGQLLHVRCLAHILNIIVKSGLRSMDKSIASIRNAVRYVKSSPSRLDFFRQCVEKSKLDVRKVCVLDVPTRWNSTYLMLSAALELRKAFDRMAEEEDNKYKSYFDEDDTYTDDEDDEEDGSLEKKRVGVKRVGPPCERDWAAASCFVGFLEQFRDVTLRVSATNTPTAQKAFHDIIIIEKEIDDLFQQRHLDGENQTQRILCDMAAKMRTKFKKYFGSIDDINKLLLVALVLDPRYKLRYYKHICEKWLKYDNSTVKEKADKLRDLVFTLTELYANSFGKKVDVEKSEEQSYNKDGGSRSSSSYSGKRAAMDATWIQALEESDQIVVSHEVDRYLLDPIEVPKAGVEFDILNWWKVNGLKYPNLALVSKDVLAIQVSTVASESCFSTGRRVIDPFRSSLSPRTVEAVICYQNWLKSEGIDNLEYLPSVEDMEFYMEAEKEGLNPLKDTADSKEATIIEKGVKNVKKHKGVKGITTTEKRSVNSAMVTSSSKKKVKSYVSSKKTNK